MLNGLSAAAARAAKALTARYRMERIVTDGFFVFLFCFVRRRKGQTKVSTGENRASESRRLSGLENKKRASSCKVDGTRD